MREKDKICHYKALEKLSTQELDTLLQEELRKEKPNEEVVLPILQVLRDREKHCPDGMTENVEESRMTDGRKTAKPKRRWIGNVAAVAAIAIILFFAVPNTVGAESVIDVLIRWTESVFEFLKPGENNDPPVEYVFRTDNPGLQQLYDKVVEMGITEPVVPMWLPEGYELVELKIMNTHDGNKVYAQYSNDQGLIIISYKELTTDTMPQYEKEPDVKMVEINRTNHFIFENLENCTATWRVGNTECIIVTNEESTSLTDMLLSIY